MRLRDLPRSATSAPTRSTSSSARSSRTTPRAIAPKPIKPTRKGSADSPPDSSQSIRAPGCCVAASSHAGRRSGTPSRFAQDERRSATSAAVASRHSVTHRPASERALAIGPRSARSRGATNSLSWRTPSPAKSRSTSETRTWTTPPGQSDPATACAKSRSPPRTARMREPHGSVIRNSSTRPWSIASAAPASPTRKSAFGRPPLCTGPAARRDASRIWLALLSTPIANSRGSLRAARRAAEPSPVPRSRIVRRRTAISWSI